MSEKLDKAKEVFNGLSKSKKRLVAFGLIVVFFVVANAVFATGYCPDPITKEVIVEKK